jgi:acyl-CoA dehydrogenase
MVPGGGRAGGVRLWVMAMNVNPIPTVDERINDIRGRTAEIVNEDILPNEAVLWRSAEDSSFTEHTEALELRAAI